MILFVVGVIFATRFLIDRANRRRLQMQSKRLFQRFQSKLKKSTNNLNHLIDTRSDGEMEGDDEFFFGR